MTDKYEFECYNCGSRFNHERILCPDCGMCDKCEQKKSLWATIITVKKR